MSMAINVLPTELGTIIMAMQEAIPKWNDFFIIFEWMKTMYFLEAMNERKQIYSLKLLYLIWPQILENHK